MSEKLCPDCGHPISEHDVVDGCMQKLPFAKDSYSYCSCDKFPADLQPKHCTGCPNPSNNYNCVSKEDCPEQPTQMPLITPQIVFDKAGEVVKSAQEQQRDADMACIHAIAAQAVKEFAEKVCEGLLFTCEDFGVSGKGYNAIVKSIRAMAEKEGVENGIIRNS